MTRWFAMSETKHGDIGKIAHLDDGTGSPRCGVEGWISGLGRTNNTKWKCPECRGHEARDSYVEMMERHLVQGLTAAEIVDTLLAEGYLVRRRPVYRIQGRKHYSPWNVRGVTGNYDEAVQIAQKTLQEVESHIYRADTDSRILRTWETTAHEVDKVMQQFKRVDGEILSV